MKKISFFIAALLLFGAGCFETQVTPQPLPTPPSSATNADMLRPTAGLPVTAEDVQYFDGMKGYFAHPEKAGSYPGVVMIHEWWGLNDQIKQMARQLAGEGYNVLAVDLYGKVVTTAADAQGLVSSLDQKKATENMRAAALYLHTHGSTKLASLGWCFGGGQSLQLALSGEPLVATVIYYGQPVKDEAQLKKITWPVLGVYGEADQAIKIDDSRAFQSSLDKAGVKNEFHFYPGVGHAFANPSAATDAPTETKDAWAKTLQFLDRAFKGSDGSAPKEQ